MIKYHFFRKCVFEATQDDNLVHLMKNSRIVIQGLAMTADRDVSAKKPSTNQQTNSSRKKSILYSYIINDFTGIVSQEGRNHACWKSLINLSSEVTNHWIGWCERSLKRLFVSKRRSDFEEGRNPLSN